MLISVSILSDCYLVKYLESDVSNLTLKLKTILTAEAAEKRKEQILRDRLKQNQSKESKI